MLFGCETALYLARKGNRVIIVEVLEEVARDMYTANRMHLLQLLGDEQVDIITEANVLEVNDTGIIIADRSGRERQLPVDTVVLSSGLKADNQLHEELRGKVPELHAIGDCVEPRKVKDAMWEGFRTARLV